MTQLAARSNEPIAGYHLGTRLGAGGYGEVWTAEAPGGLIKAIKFVYGLLDEDRAAREMKALNRIKGVRHPFLLSLERIEVVDGQLLIVTELADCSLKDRFEKCRQAGASGIERGELLGYLRDTADALDYMNEQHSLQHLDVKPENLLLVGGRVKVADFGLVKDLHDVTASLMGGLTPIYAPPEVFEGRPSRRSDQYSLAIVYQEMLTGMLPFPGRSAAQLAAQHLNTRPRLSPLPTADQAVIGRALSKKPEERFASCRELADALLIAGQRAAVAITPGVTEARPTIPSPASRANSSAANVATENPRSPADMMADLNSASAAVQSVTSDASGSGDLRRSLTADEVALGISQAWEPQELEAASPVVDLPPLAIDPLAWRPQPTLFIGIGGAAGKALQKLRSRLDDRFDGAERGLFSMLLLDTDQHDLMRVTHGEDGAALAASETLFLPLRKTQDYRTDSRKILEWLSRRWLYNIPRSLQTEGMRPLGRLALVDHADRVHSRLREATSELRACAERQETGEPAETAPNRNPRVVLVAAISGGTGSGMVLDLIYATRQALDEQKLSQAEVSAVLLHGTSRSPAQQELATVNAHALLAELNHFTRPGGSFPGDPACGLIPRPSHAATLDHAYLLHLGEELSPVEFEAAVDRTAEFLLLDTGTAAGDGLRAGREASVSEGDSCRSEVLLRSASLRQIGFAQDSLVQAAVQRVSQIAVERWLGVPRPVPAKKASWMSIPAAAPSGDNEAAALDAEVIEPATSPIETRAAETAARWGLSVDSLVQQVYGAAVAEMQGNADAVFQRIVAAYPAKNKPDAAVAHWLSAAAELFGARPADPDAPRPPRTPLQAAFERRALELVPKVGQELRQWVLALAEEPGVRIAGALQAAKWQIAHLKELVEKLREMKNRFGFEAIQSEQQLLPPDPRQKSRSPRPATADLAGIFFQRCRLQLFEAAAGIAGQICQALQSHLVAASEQVQDTSRDLKQLCGRYRDAAQESDANAAPTDELTPVRFAVSETLRRKDEELAARIDSHLTASLFATSGGLRTILATGGEVREQFLKQFAALARQGVLNNLQAIDLSTMLLSEGGFTSEANPLRKCLAAIQPRLQTCGGQRRLLCVVPRTSQVDADNLAKHLGSDVFRQLPMVVRDDSSDVVLLFELGRLSIHQVASTLIDHRPDLAEVASRVHTRSDIDWQPLLLRQS